jgi:hypothetical protein
MFLPRHRAAQDAPQGPNLTSDRMEAKCAIFDARDTISASGGNAIGKMKFFAQNNHNYDLQELEQAQERSNCDSKPRKIRNFSARDRRTESNVVILQLTIYDRID